MSKARQTPPRGESPPPATPGAAIRRRQGQRMSDADRQAAHAAAVAALLAGDTEADTRAAIAARFALAPAGAAARGVIKRAADQLAARANRSADLVRAEAEADLRALQASLAGIMADPEAPAAVRVSAAAAARACIRDRVAMHGASKAAPRAPAADQPGAQLTQVNGDIILLDGSADLSARLLAAQRRAAAAIEAAAARALPAPASSTAAQPDGYTSLPADAVQRAQHQHTSLQAQPPPGTVRTGGDQPTRATRPRGVDAASITPGARLLPEL